MITVGLFGTCGSSEWRAPFIARLDELFVRYFNPQVAPGTWHPGMVEDENRHLAEDEIILFPVTHETLGNGSLGEIGFSIAHALRLNRNRFFVFMIDDECSDPSITEAERKDNRKTRALVKSKLTTMAAVTPNVYVVDDLDAMHALMTQLIKVAEALEEAEGFKAKRA